MRWFACWPRSWKFACQVYKNKIDVVVLTITKRVYVHPTRLQPGIYGEKRVSFTLKRKLPLKLFENCL